MLNKIQYNLIQSKVEDNEKNEIIEFIQKGEIEKVIQSNIGKYILSTPVSVKSEEELKNKNIKSYITLQSEEYINDFSGNKEEAEFNILCLAISCLNALVRNAFTGPLMEIKLTEIIPFDKEINMEELNKKILNDLSVDTEEVFHLIPEPLYLLLAISLFEFLNENDTTLVTFSWWYSRCLFVQQRVLENPAGTLKDKIINNMEKCLSIIPELNDETRDLHTRFYVEYGIIYHYYRKDQKAFDLFKKGQEISNFKWTYSGALGKRTKYQQENIAQLVILAESDIKNDEKDADEDVKENGESSSNKPDNLSLNDDLLLDKIDFAKSDSNEKDLNKQENLKTIDQCLLLAFCLNVKNTNPSHGITTEQMFPFVNRVLNNPNNWMVHTMGLLLRSRLEGEKIRTMERGVLQLQALVDQIVCFDSTAGERLEYFYSIIIPPKWEMERELADRFMRLGVVLTALDIYKRLELWEDVIVCYQAAEKNDKAEELVRERLVIEPRSPKLWCLLGQITNDPECYIKAWEYSGHHYARAQRSLGAYYYKKLDYVKSVESYKKALVLNPLFEGSWFILGCASMNIQEWDTAIDAWNRVINLDSENGEAWNNLASVYSKLKQKRKAWKAFQEAIKSKYDNAKIWMNYLYSSIDLGEFNEAIRSMNQILEHLYQKDVKNAVDIEILQIIVNSLIRDIKDCDGQLINPEKVEKLLNHITSKIGNSIEIFKICYSFWLWKKDYRKALDYKLKAYRINLHNPNLLNQQELFDEITELAIELVEDYENLGPKTLNNGELVMEDWIYQSKMILRTLISRTKSTYEGTESHEKLKEKQKEIQTIERESR